MSLLHSFLEDKRALHSLLVKWMEMSEWCISEKSLLCKTRDVVLSQFLMQEGTKALRQSTLEWTEMGLRS